MNAIPESNFHVLTSATILQMKSPIELFVFDKEKCKTRYQKLISLWHPDKNSDPEAGNVFYKIKTLYEKAIQQIDLGVWGSLQIIKFNAKDRYFEFAYFKEDQLSGNILQYTGSNSIVFYFPDRTKYLIDIWKNNFHKLKNTTDLPGSNSEFSAQLLTNPKIFDVNDGTLVKISKQNRYLNLQHIIEAGVSFDPKDIAWVISRLMSLACFLQSKNVPNADIQPRSVFIDTINHSVFLSNGFQFVEGFTQQGKAFPSRAVSLNPEISVNKTFRAKYMVSQIKATARELLGDSTGVFLHKNTNIPKDLIQWCNAGVNSESCLAEFKEWDLVKVKSFGPPKFKNHIVTQEDIYK